MEQVLGEFRSADPVPRVFRTALRNKREMMSIKSTAPVPYVFPSFNCLDTITLLFLPT